MNARLFGAWAVAAVMLSGCATPWHKPGGTQAEFEQTLNGCGMESQQAVPELISYAMVPGSSYRTMSCNKHNQCSEYSTFTPPTLAPYDRNASARAQYVRACLYRNGWSDQDEKD